MPNRSVAWILSVAFALICAASAWGSGQTNPTSVADVCLEGAVSVL